MSGRVTPIPEKLGKIVDALRWPSKGPTISGKFVEKVIGHCIHFMMLRRELLAIFRSLYQFVHDNYWHRRRLWPWARSEANWAAVCWQSRLLILDVLGTARFLHRMLHFLVSVFASLIFHMKSLNGLGILRKLGDTKLNLPLPLERLLFHMMTSLKV